MKIKLCLSLTAIIILTLIHNKNNKLKTPTSNTNQLQQIVSPNLYSKVQIKLGNTITEQTLLEYLTGVVAAEISPEYENEAIKAQIVASHTYAINKYGPNGPYPSDPNVFQAYIPKEKRQSKYKDNFDKYENKFVKNIKSVANEIITYNNQPIKAVYHSISGGKTQNSIDVWGSNIPYLTVTDSSIDSNLTNYFTVKSVSIEDIFSKIKSNNSNANIPTNKNEIVKIISRTTADYVKNAKICNIELSGDQIRHIFKLPSSNFTTKIQDNKVIFLCKGCGHGVGMSQCGSNELAKKGKTYEEIIKHYYPGVEIQKI